MDGWTNGQMDGQTDRQMDGWTNGQMDGQRDGWMNGRTDECGYYNLGDRKVDTHICRVHV